MATSSQNRAFQAYNSHNFKNRPATKKPSVSTTAEESLVFDRVPYSSIKTTVEQTSSTSAAAPNANSMVKPTSTTAKRDPSITSLSHLLPISPRKGLQMTALASQRQSLWISIAKNAQTNDTSASPLPFLRQQQTSLTRKKLLRLLLVFSYLLSISLFAIGLATFYGFFWTGYSTSSMANVETPASAILSLTSNSTFIETNLPTEEDAVMKN